MAFIKCSGGGINFLPELKVDTGILFQRILSSSYVPLIWYDPIPDSTSNYWGRQAHGTTDYNYWMGIANTKNKTTVHRNSNSYAPVAHGINVSGNVYTLTALNFSSNIANCSNYDYTLVCSTNAAAAAYVWFE